MNAREFAGLLKDLIQEARDHQVTAIPVDDLINYLSSVEQSENEEPSAAEMERYKALLQMHTEAYKHQAAIGLESFRAAINFGLNANRNMILVNGGAAAALLAFIGHLASVKPSAIPVFADCLTFFVAGTLIAGLVSGGTYLSQLCYSHDWNVWGTIFNVVVIVFGIASYGAFAWGALSAYHAFSNPLLTGIN